MRREKPAQRRRGVGRGSGRPALALAHDARESPLPTPLAGRRSCCECRAALGVVVMPVGGRQDGSIALGCAGWRSAWFLAFVMGRASGDLAAARRGRYGRRRPSSEGRLGARRRTPQIAAGRLSPSRPSAPPLSVSRRAGAGNGRRLRLTRPVIRVSVAFDPRQAGGPESPVAVAFPPTRCCTPGRADAGRWPRIRVPRPLLGPRHRPRGARPYRVLIGESGWR